MAAIQHMVLLKFKDDVPSEKIDELFERLAALRESIAGITDFSGGPYSSHEGLNHGYTHGFLMTFVDAAARDAYLPHPAHEQVKQAILPWIDGVVAFDFEVS